jgi:cell wall-associated NlpC family hydrolase
MRDRSQVVATARRAVGARFRPHGRDPAWGLDCVGLAALAFDVGVPARYPLRGGSPDTAAAMAMAAGLRPRDPVDAGPGDLLLLAAGAHQLHLAVLTERGFVHADAGLRRVVETPGRPPHPRLAAWGIG